MAGKDSTSRRLWCPSVRTALLVVDIVCFTSALASVLVFMLAVQPFARGFYCDDRSISKPYKRNSISVGVLVVFSFLVPAIAILATESFYYLRNPRKLTKSLIMCPGIHCHVLICVVVELYSALLFGAAVTVILTDVGKYSLGALRPHFLAVCKPDLSRVNCSDGYIIKEVCTGEPALIKEARLSFPSGHSSLAAYAMGFVVLYVEAKVHIPKSKFVKPTIQLLATILAFGTGYSRVSDDQHHWSDVLAGFAIGAVVAGFFSCRVLKLFHSSHRDISPHKSPSVATITTWL